MMMQNFNNAETIVSPAIPAMIAKAPHTDKIRISPMRWRALHASIRATASPGASVQPLRPAMQSLFMATTAYFHVHLEAAMGPGLASALQRIRDAGQGLFVSQNILFVDLRQIALSPAGKDASVARAVHLAGQALLTRIMQ